MSSDTYQISVDYAGRVHVLEPSEDLVEKVLDKLLLQRPTSEQTMQIGTEELRDKVDVFKGRDEDV